MLRIVEGRPCRVLGKLHASKKVNSMRSLTEGACYKKNSLAEGCVRVFEKNCVHIALDS